jgi:hypothetical protein
MIHERGTGPQNRLSSELPRLSPITYTSPLGTVTARGKSQPLPGSHGAANGSLWTRPLRMTWPLRTAMRSPSTPTTRLMNVCDERARVGRSHGVSESPPWPEAPQTAG